MAYLDIEKLNKGTVYFTEKNGVKVYLKMEDGAYLVGPKLDGAFVKTFNMSHFSNKDWNEVFTKNVYALTEVAKEILENVTVDVVFKISNQEDYKILLEALQNSTDFTWRSGDDLLEQTKYRESLLLHIENNTVTWCDYDGHISHFPDSVFIDFSASKSVLVDMIEIEGVVF